MIKLITKVLIFLTAIIGLYKTIKFSPEFISKQSSNNYNGDSNNNLRIVDIFKPLLTYISVFIMMLAMPAFIFGFLYIMEAIDNIGEEPKRKELKESSIEKNLFSKSKLKNVPKEQEKYYILAQSALNIPNNNKMNDYLTNLVKNTVKDNYYEISIMVANEITNSTQKDKMLKLIIEKAVENNEYKKALKALSLISSSSQKEDSALFIYNNLEVN